MKKIFNFLLIFVLSFTFINNISAKTVGDLKTELEALESDLNNIENKNKATKDEISYANKKVKELSESIEKSQNDIKYINEEIVKLNEQMAIKNEEIKKIVNFSQVSNGESVYIEYAFGASDFTDFIYRSAVAEQLSDYNDNLIAEYNQLISDNNDKKIELDSKIKQMEKQSDDLSKQLKLLENELNEIYEVRIDVQEQIRLQKEAIKLYESLGCEDDENINTCGKSTLPKDTAFYRPVNSGSITSEYGWRYSPIYGYSELHSGMDIAASGSSVPVYATANGLVVGITWRSSCGGNVIYIQHVINGQTYTSMYMHLRSILVNKGDVVTSSTQIATMGGSPSIETWDGCSTGQHLHFTLAKGLYLTDYYDWSTFMAKTVNPRSLVNFPSYYFSDRITRY